MKKLTLTSALLLIAGVLTIAYGQKVWRVNNVDALPKDFNDLQAAINAASPGDTIYIEGTSVAYGNTSSAYAPTLNKRLVLIGPGYFLEGASGNPNLQYNTTEANIQTIRIDSLASGSEFIGLRLYYITFYNANGTRADSLRFSRCVFDLGISVNYTQPAGAIAENWVFDKCYFKYVNTAYGLITTNLRTKDWDIRNNIIDGVLSMNHANTTGTLIRNNVLRRNIDVNNAYMINNILPNTTISLVSTVAKNNMAIGTPAGFNAFVGNDNNTNGYTDADLFQGATDNSTDGQWRLKTGSPAISAGLEIDGITPDIGAFGGPDPYVLSGIPPIPTIYDITMPSTIASGTQTMDVEFSSRSNN